MLNYCFFCLERYLSNKFARIIYDLQQSNVHEI